MRLFGGIADRKLGGTVMSKEVKDIKIPIKDLLQTSVVKHMVSYEEDEFNLLRKYYIACLNMGFFEPKDLTDMINKFTSKIKSITTDCKVMHLLDSYFVDYSVLYIDGELKYENPKQYEINFYKAVTETIFNYHETNVGIGCALIEMAAEKIYTMDEKGSRLIMPKTSVEKIGDKSIEIRAGYENYNLLVSCLKQLFIARNINENIVIRDMYFEGYDAVLSQLCADRLNFKNSQALVSLLDNICLMYVQRMTKKKTHPKEMETLRVYQRFVNKLFEKQYGSNYLAFLALVTEDDLRSEFMNNADL